MRKKTLIVILIAFFCSTILIDLFVLSRLGFLMSNIVLLFEILCLSILTMVAVVLFCLYQKKIVGDTFANIVAGFYGIGGCIMLGLVASKSFSSNEVLPILSFPLALINASLLYFFYFKQQGKR